jgi:hypothetical protein
VPRPLTPALVASTAAPTVAAVPAVAPVDAWVPGPAPAPAASPRRFYAVLAALTLSLGALSLLAPSTPSYDPWSWIVWAREIVHGHLTITSSGTSWKPLPMLFTIPFALAGRAAPDLWLMVARAGAIAAVLMAARLAYRFTRALGDAAQGLAARLPAILAAVIAAAALGFAASGDYISSNGLGYSEALATALLLVALECHLDGRRRAAFLVGFLVALDRPEIWLFWVPYGLWLARRDRAMRPLVAACLVAQPIVWFVPVYLGSGHFGASVTRAQHPRANSLAFASSPFLSELGHAAWPTMMLRIKIMGLLVIPGAGALLWGGYRRHGGAAVLATPRARALGAAALFGVGAIAWFVLIALMTQLGFSGNDRYLVLGSALLDICGAVGFGWLALELGRALGAVRAPGVLRSLRRPPGLAGAGALGATAVFMLAPAWLLAQDFVSLPRLHGSLLYQARLRENLPRAIAAGGGARALERCGQIMTEGFQVPMVAYSLGVATPRVLEPPQAGEGPGPAPNVILQTQATRSATLLPVVRTWPRVHYTYRGSFGPWNLFTHCTTRP